MGDIKREEAQERLNNFVELFKSEKELTGYMNLIVFSEVPKNAPIRRWSFFNQLLIHIQKTQDARGYKQWQEVGRYVKKGSKAIKIFGPVFKKAETECKNCIGVKCIKCEGTGKIKENILIGFKEIPVFRFEDTEGKELDETNAPKVPDDLPLLDVAKILNIEVKAIHFEGGAWGRIDHEANGIILMSPEEQVFFHELAHGIDIKLGNYEKSDYKDGEVVAELGACLLASYYGESVNLKFTKEYIEAWAGKDHVAIAIGRLLDRVWQVWEKVQEIVTIKEIEAVAV